MQEQINRQYFFLTEPQKRIWHTQQIYPTSSMFNIGGRVDIEGSIDINVLMKALCRVINNNIAFSTRIGLIENKYMQWYEPCDYKELDYFDFSDDMNSDERFNEWFEDLAQKPFSMAPESRLFYACVFKKNSQHYGYAIKLHHVIADGWSTQLISHQTKQYYEDIKQGDDKINIENYQYTEFIKSHIEYLGTERYEKDRQYWLSSFRKLPGELPAYAKKLQGIRETWYIQNDQSERLRKFVKQIGVSLNTFFTAAYYLFIMHTDGAIEKTIGIPCLGRMGRRERNIIGMFTSTIPFHFVIQEEETICQMMKRMQIQMKSCYKHYNYPYNHLLQELGVAQKGISGFFETCINYYHTSMSSKFDNAQATTKEFFCKEQTHALQIVIRDWDDEKGIQVDFDYKIGIFENHHIESMFNAFISLIDMCVNQIDINVCDVNLLTEEEKQKYIYEFNKTDVDVPKGITLIDLFVKQAKITPSNIAVFEQGYSYTYEELDQKSNAVASFLAKSGVGHGSIVGIMMDISVEVIIIILGILKTGAAYLPIDLRYPEQRVSYMLKNAGCTLLVTNYNRSGFDFDGNILYASECFNQLSEQNYIQSATQADIAYIIYTSGSTGTPKGVMIGHDNLLNYLCWAVDAYRITEDDVFPLYSSIAFDLTITSLFTPLITGASIAIYVDGDEPAIHQIINDQKATIIKLTPTHLRVIKDYIKDNTALTRMILGGEDLNHSLADKVVRESKGRITVFNEYGPTEATVGCMIHKFNASEDLSGSVPIGRPAGNTKIFLLNKYKKMVPTGFAGEICISGAGVSRGYINQTQITEERFVQLSNLDCRIYRTGDMAKFNENGILEYVGRIDKQVKLHGFRIELDEIRQVLLNWEQVNDAYVMIRGLNEQNQYICAYIIADEFIYEQAAKDYLSTVLPQYMVPTRIICLDVFPQTTNGKIDANALPDPFTIRTTLEKDNKKLIVDKNCKVFLSAVSYVLNRNNVFLDDNFFVLGGDSITAMQLSAKLKEEGLVLPVHQIMAHPKLDDMYTFVEQKSKKIEQRYATGEILNTPILSWFFKHSLKNINHFNQNFALEIEGKWTITDIKNAFHELIRHHDSLRINCDLEKRALYYNSVHIDNPPVVKEYLIKDENIEEMIETIVGIMMENNKQFDITSSLLIKACLFRLTSGSQIIVFTAHHLVVDGVSWNILTEDFKTLLTNKNGLPDKTCSFQEWACFINSSENEKKTQLVQVDNIKSMYLGSRNIATGKGFYQTKFYMSYMKEQVDTLLGSQEHFLNEIFLTCFLHAISIEFDQNDITIELESHGRDFKQTNLDLTRTIGWFTTIPLFFISFDSKGISERYRQVKHQLANIKNSFEEYDRTKQRTMEDDGYINRKIRFNYLGNIFSNLQLDNNVKNIPLIVRLQECNSDPYNALSSDLEFNCALYDKKLCIFIRYNCDLYSEETLNNILNNFITAWNYMIENPREMDEITKESFLEVNLNQEEWESLFL